MVSFEKEILGTFKNSMEKSFLPITRSGQKPGTHNRGVKDSSVILYIAICA